MLRKRSKNGSSLFKEYFTILSLVILICFLILGISLTFFVQNYWEGERIKLLSENANSISETLVNLISSEHAQKNPSNAALMICNDLTMLSKAIDADIFVCDKNGGVVYCKEMRLSDMVLFTGACPIHQKYKLPPSIVNSLDESDYSGISTLDGVLPKKSFVYAAPIVLEGNTIGIVVAVQTVSDTMRPFILSILEIFGLSSLFALVVALITVYFMSYELTKPLRQMSAATKSYANGDFSARVTVTGNNEMADLAKAFNSMAKDLASLESSRRSFVANISHELKTPMTTIGGFIDGILDGTIADESKDSYLRIVSDEVKRLARLVTGMLNMSRIEIGEMNLKPREFDVAEMLFKTTVGFEQLVAKKGVEITGLDKIEPTEILADEDMIHQVIYNLVDNAVKFTPEGGNIDFKVFTDAQKVYISIRNTGAGIPAEECGKIFERFYKLDKSRSYDIKGAGLGLYICKSIVEMHGGQIKVSSVVNQHTEFSFWLPLKPRGGSS